MAYLDIFGNTQLLGNWENPDAPSPRPELWRIKFPGLAGEGEIYGRPGGRPVRFAVWVYPLLALEWADQMRIALDGLVGIHGAVTEYPDNLFGARVWDNMTFVGWSSLPVGGRLGPLYSAGGSLTGWFWPISLEFYQLLAGAQQSGP